MIYIFSIFIPIGMYFSFPLIIKILTGRLPKKDILLLIACLVYAISWFVPSPLIEGKDTSFMTHLVGGGVFTGFFWLYLKDHLKWKMTPAVDILSLYVLVSTLGVTNELLELLAAKLGIIHINGWDTWWDLLANTMGALLFYLAYYCLFKINRKQSQK